MSITLFARNLYPSCSDISVSKMGKYYDSSDKNIIKKGETAFF
jgi:hypothetical protein